MEFSNRKEEEKEKRNRKGGKNLRQINSRRLRW